jgi:hypothetical protein
MSQETYTGAEVYKMMQDSLDFMRQRVASLESQRVGLTRRVTEFEGQIDVTSRQLATSYLERGDLHNPKFRQGVQAATGANLANIVTKYDSQRKQIETTRTKLSASRFYIMRGVMALAVDSTDEELVFEDERINDILALEEHPGYTGDEGLIPSGFVEGTHRRGWFGFRHRRLSALAEAVAEDLGYEDWDEMENGHTGDFSDLDQRSGRKELRYSVPLLAVNPDKSVKEVKEAVDRVVTQYDSLTDRIESVDQRMDHEAIEVLAEHLEVVQLSNLVVEDIEGAEGLVIALRTLKVGRKTVRRSISNVDGEVREYTQRVTELTETLIKYSQLKTSAKTIPKATIDRSFTRDQGVLVPISVRELRALDDVIQRDFPRAVSYRVSQRRVHNPSQAEYRRALRRSGGKVGQWSDWE